MRRSVLLPAMLFLVAASPPYLPDPLTTPGAANPDITPENMSETICNPSWSTKSIRPPASYTDELKRKQLSDPQYDDKNTSDYEEDHLISLEIGGDPRSENNLWPEPYTPWQGSACGARVKDRLEDKLHKMVCAGQIDLRQAQHEISTDWVKSYNEHIGPLKCE